MFSHLQRLGLEENKKLVQGPLKGYFKKLFFEGV